MRCLVMDRSSAKPGLALFENSVLVRERTWDGEPTRAPEWMADVAQTLREENWSVAEIARFVCGLGPGSFSGIRACLSALHGMALPGNRPVVGIASAAALALGAAQGEERITVIGDARRNRLWCVTYRVNSESGCVRLDNACLPTHTSQDFTLVPADSLQESVPFGTRIVSADWQRLESILMAIFESHRLVRSVCYPCASTLGRVAFSESTANLSEPLPIYLHPAVSQYGG